jgi:hypothetical protein
MYGPSLIVVDMPIVILIALFTGIALPFIVGSQPRRSHAAGRLARADALKRIRAARRNAHPPNPGAARAARVEYLYVPFVRYHGRPAGARRRVQAVPIVRKTAKWIYYASDTWDRSEAVVSPGRISRKEFETATRRSAPAGGLFFATREAAEAELHREERERAGQAAWEASPIKALRRAMAEAHPDRGGTAEQFIEARRRYETALQPARR